MKKMNRILQSYAHSSQKFPRCAGRELNIPTFVCKRLRLCASPASFINITEDKHNNSCGSSGSSNKLAKVSNEFDYRRDIYHESEIGHFEHF
ncbi:hypothetical protein NPIL_87781 [Nephila pilipes]|uniref:Uncharacterized protein n=1 Tax=Nephila pilipes TaxID=299642 RepID=A0A8X6TTE6_NEPPI|nr:hypothetical protein NPIL_87781 [Nephila pilipes]